MRDLAIGHLTADLDGFDLRGVRWHGVEVVNRLYAAVRDARWGTPAGSGTDPTTEDLGDALRVRFAVDHSGAGMPFRWEGEYVLSDDGIVATFDGVALAPLETSRAGWCLLHPLSQVGGRLQFSLDGVASELVLPELLMPQELDAHGRPMAAFGPFDSLVLDANGVRMTAHFEGDLFETEDQRNWTDASFKTYCTPLSEPYPKRFDPGQRVTQRITLRFERGEAAPSSLGRASTASAGPGLLSVIVSAAPSDADLAAAFTVVDRLRAEATHPNDGVIHAVRAAARPWELSVLADDDTDWSALRDVLLTGTPPELVLVLPADPAVESASPGWVAAARAALGGSVERVGGGTRSNFTELLRHPVSGMDVVGCTWSPLVHADDARSIAETPESYPAIVATAHHIAPGAEFTVGPLRDVDALDPAWVATSVRAWLEAGADRVCVARLEQLVSHGDLTAVGRSLRAMRGR